MIKITATQVKPLLKTKKRIYFIAKVTEEGIKICNLGVDGKYKVGDNYFLVIYNDSNKLFEFFDIERKKMEFKGDIRSTSFGDSDIKRFIEEIKELGHDWYLLNKEEMAVIDSGMMLQELAK